MVESIENTDPLLAQLIYDVCNKIYDRFNVKSIHQQGLELVTIPYKKYTGQRNDKCWCGSNKKWKKCDCFQYHM